MALLIQHACGRMMPSGDRCGGIASHQGGPSGVRSSAMATRRWCAPADVMSAGPRKTLAFPRRNRLALGRVPRRDEYSAQAGRGGPARAERDADPGVAERFGQHPQKACCDPGHHPTRPTYGFARPARSTARCGEIRHRHMSSWLCVRPTLAPNDGRLFDGPAYAVLWFDQLRANPVKVLLCLALLSDACRPRRRQIGSEDFGGSAIVAGRRMPIRRLRAT